MKGTGTQTDPFVIMTIDDLYSMEELGGTGIFCRLGADIELNGTPYARNFVPIPVNWSSLDGNGHKIRNIYALNPSDKVCVFRVMTGGTISISGLMIENAYLSGTMVNLFKADEGVTAGINLTDSAVMLKISNSKSSLASGSECIIHGTGLTVSTDLTVVAVSAVLNRGWPVFYGGNIRRTQLILDILVHDEGSVQIYETAVFRNLTLSDSWITGNIRCDAEASPHLFHISDRYSEFSNFYQAVSMNGIDQVYCGCEFLTPCFYDNELMAGAVYKSTDEAFFGLTTEQCKNPEYLNSIGFMCVGDSDGI